MWCVSLVVSCVVCVGRNVWLNERLHVLLAGTSYYALVDRRTLERMQDLQAKGDLFLGLFLQKDPNPNVKVPPASEMAFRRKAPGPRLMLGLYLRVACNSGG